MNASVIHFSVWNFPEFCNAVLGLTDQEKLLPSQCPGCEEKHKGKITHSFTCLPRSSMTSPPTSPPPLPAWDFIFQQHQTTSHMLDYCPQSPKSTHTHRRHSSNPELWRFRSGLDTRHVSILCATIILYASFSHCTCNTLPIIASLCVCLPFPTISSHILISSVPYIDSDT